MVFLYLLFVLILILWRIKIKENDGYLSIERCNSIKGIFILLIVLTHSMGYFDSCGYEYAGLDRLVLLFRKGIGQLVVVMFLFYSGYGVSLSIKKKGEEYVDKMPRHRLLPTLLNFDIAVLAFVIMNLIMAKTMTTRQVVLSMIAWEDVGNSNWYIFVILLCYAITYGVAKLVRRKDQWKWLFATLLVCVLVLSVFKRVYWYNTMLAYPAGFFFAEYESKIIGVMRKYYVPLLIIFASAFVLSFYYMPTARGLSKNFASICFALMVVMLSMKVVIGNAFLRWWGSHLFPLYIYQRIPMILMLEYIGKDFVGGYPILFVTTALLITCGIAHFHKYWTIK